MTAVIGQPAGFTASLDATCMTVTVDRTPYYTGANSTYAWNFGDGFTSTAGVPAPHTYATTGNYTISLQVTDAVGCVTNFSIPVNIGCVLPITLTDFTGVYNGSTVDLNWKTASEINNDYFTIERSKDAKTFEVVGIKDGHGNSQMVNAYNMEDKDPIKGVNYYRLKQTDYDGKYSLSNTIAVRIKSNIENLAVYPNPVTGNGFLSFNAIRNDDYVVTIYDLVGKKVLSNHYKIDKGLNKLNLSTENLEAGMYFLTIGDVNEQKKVRFIKN